MVVRPCFECDKDTEMFQSLEPQKFEYGPEGNSVTLEVVVPVWNCTACHAMSTDGEAEDIRDAAVRKHLEKVRVR